MTHTEHKMLTITSQSGPSTSTQQIFSPSLEICHFLDGLQAAPLVREVEGFKYVWEGGVMPTDPLHWSFQVKKTFLLYGGSNLSPEPTSVGSLVTYNTATGLHDGLVNSFLVPRQDGHQVNHLKEVIVKNNH